MGLTGTDVAKEAADVILVNDNFATIVDAIEEGRAIFDNLRKFVTYIFSSNVPEILPFILTAMVNIPLALTVRQILAIDLGTDMLPGLALGTEKPEPDIMQRKPRRRDQPLLDRKLLQRAFLWLGLIETVLAFSGFFLVYAFAGDFALLQRFAPQNTFQGLISVYPIQALAVTVYHAGVVLAQVGNAFACRSEVKRGRSLGWTSNRFLILGIAVEIALIMILIYFTPLAIVFQHVPIPPVFWLWLGFYPFVLYGLEWQRKNLVRGQGQKQKSSEVL
jgi:P-type Ca2+ transporter type 2C